MLFGVPTGRYPLSREADRHRSRDHPHSRGFLKNPPPLTGETNLIADLALESVQVMEFVVEVEDHYDIAIDLESLSNVHTIGELAAVVARHRLRHPGASTIDESDHEPAGQVRRLSDSVRAP
jgi:acyl carrier protein